jgi:hypothetical protein
MLPTPAYLVAFDGVVSELSSSELSSSELSSSVVASVGNDEEPHILYDRHFLN